MNGLTKYLRAGFGLSVIAFFILFSIFHASTPRGAGDEMGFIMDLESIRVNGWAASVANGMAVTLMLLAYPMYQLFPDFVAIRLVNTLLFIGLLAYFRFRGQIRNPMFYAYFAFFSSCGWFLLGTNDALFVVMMVIFLNESQQMLQRTQANPAWMWSALVVLIFTRELVYVYAPVLLATIGLLLWRRAPIFKNLAIPAFLLGLLLAINIPSITTRGSLSYDQKPPPQGVVSTWPQRQYLAQLMVNEGKLSNFKHPGWKQTDSYLQQNGPDSLPRTVLEGLFFDLNLTIREFFKDFFYAVRDSIRLAGFPLHIGFIYLVVSLLRRRTFDPQLYFPAVALAMYVLFSLIIISYVELRWLFPVIIVSLIGYSRLEADRKIPQWIVAVNYLFYFAIMAYGIYRVIPKMHL